MLVEAASLVVGLALIVKGGDLFVRSAVGMAELLRIPRLVVGATIMSLATTAPEIAVSIMSGLEEASDLAIGNAAGSVVCNIGLIAAASAVLGVVSTHRHEISTPFAALALAALAVLAMAWDGTITRGDAATLLACGVAYVAVDLVRHLKGRGGTVEEASAISEEHHPTTTWKGTAGLFAVGAVMVVGGSRLLVDGAVAIATSLGVPPLVVGLTVVSVGTSLPELITAISSARRGVSDLAIGNIIGANISNLTLVAGSAGVLYPIAIGRMDLLQHVLPMMVFVGGFGWLTLARGGITRRAGWCLAGGYVAYLTLVVATARG